MGVGFFLGVLGRESSATHQRIAEQTIRGLHLLLADVRCTDEEQQAIEEFLTLRR